MKQLAFPIALPPLKIAVPPKLLNWILCWIVLPNIGFCLLWVVGGPPRFPAILVTGATGLVVRKAPFSIKFACFMAALAFSILSFIGSVFSLHLASLLLAIEFMVELKPSASGEYITLTGFILATAAAAWWMLRKPTDFHETKEVVVSALMIVALVGADLLMTAGSRGSYMRLAPDGAAFSSATQQADLLKIADGKNNLLIVVVEAMGLPQDKVLRDRLLARWKAPDIAARYSIESGSTPFYGSTTSAELRELCGRWGDYPELMEGFHGECLPARLARKGYRTTAVHSFGGDFFDRRHWYPRIGFQSMVFSDDLVEMGAARCPGVFAGACDRDVPAILARQLKQTRQPQFVYWLTVNSHVPVPESGELQTRNCADFDPALAKDQAMICRMFKLWADLDASLAAILTDPSLPPTDVLLVGDHMPPFFARGQRLMFDSERVPWILLKRKDTPPAP